MSIEGYATLLLLSLSMTGCQSLRLHVDARDKQGQEAKKAWEAVDFDATVKTERDNLAKLMSAELDSAGKVQVAIRDDYVRYLVGSTLRVGLAERLADMHLQLVGTSDVSATIDKVTAFKVRPVDLSPLNDDFQKFNLGPALCTFASPDLSPQMKKALTSTDVSLKAQAAADLKQLDKVCSAPKPPPIEDSFRGGGYLATYTSMRGHAKAELDALKEEAIDLQKTYENAKADFDKAAKENAVDSVKQLTDLADKLKSAADKLSNSSNPLAQKFMANESISALNDFVKALGETPTDPSKIPTTDKSGAAKAAVALVIIPRLMDEATTAANEQRAMRALQLQMQANYQQLLLAAATRDVQSREQELQLYNELVATTLKEALQLSQAYRELNLGPPQPGSKQMASLSDWMDKPVTDLTSKATPDQKQLFYYSAGLYLDALHRLETARASLQLKINAAIFERALAYSEVNAKQWTSLIGLSVNQIADSAASGIKSETVTNLLNTIGLWGTAIGVNNK